MKVVAAYSGSDLGDLGYASAIIKNNVLSGASSAVYIHGGTGHLLDGNELRGEGQFAADEVTEFAFDELVDAVETVFHESCALRRKLRRLGGRPGASQRQRAALDRLITGFARPSRVCSTR